MNGKMENAGKRKKNENMRGRGNGEKHETYETEEKRIGEETDRKNKNIARTKQKETPLLYHSDKHHTTSTEVTVHVCLSLEPGMTWQLRRRNLSLLARSEGKNAKGFLQAPRKDGTNGKYWLGSVADNRLPETVQ
jgi:hypothetical protein